MSGEENKSAEQFGVLGSCLIEGDAEQKTRERKTKRRALTISILLQSLSLVAIVMVPLLGHTEKISYRSAIPMPPYRPIPNRPIREVRSQSPQPPQVCFQCFRDISARPIEHDNHRLAPTAPDEPYIDGQIGISGVPDGNPFDNRRTPAPPEEPNRKKRLVVGGAVQQAMLTRRVEPVYPPLSRQLRRSGQVHLRAVISVDGSVGSLQVIDGDPLFIQASLDAVRQWRYRPTSLNGVPVEVETIITVIYTLNP
jgi:protein TonB